MNQAKWLLLENMISKREKVYMVGLRHFGRHIGFELTSIPRFGHQLELRAIGRSRTAFALCDGAYRGSSLFSLKKTQEMLML